MNQINVNDLINKIRNNQINYDNIYNLDVEMIQHHAIQYYLANEHDNSKIDQKLFILPLDIEVYTNHTGIFLPNNAVSPISAITIWNPRQNIYQCYFLVLPHIKQLMKSIPEIEQYIKTELVKTNYIEDTDNISLFLFENEIDMITTCWLDIRSIDPTILTGFNADIYDIPYIYNRLNKLIGKEKTEQILSKFEFVKVRKMGDKILYQIPELPLLDIRHLYMPREEGGLNYGKTQPSYSLDWLSSQILKLNKIDTTETGKSLDKLYDTNPIQYILYNIGDVVLTKKLNDKLKHIEIHNLIRRDMKTPLSLSVRGQSALFDTFLSYELEKTNDVMKYGIILETKNHLSLKDINDIRNTCTIKHRKIKLSLNEVNISTYQQILNRYPGAYVKEGYNDIIDSKSGLIIDLDASSLYPSMMQQYNISFDSYYGRIIDPACYSLIEYLDSILGTNKKIDNFIFESILSNVDSYVDKLDPQNKTEYKQNLFYMISDLIIKLKKINKKITSFFIPTNKKDYMILKMYIIPLLDLITDIHPSVNECNTFTYEYSTNNKIISPFIYIITNAQQPIIKIEKIEGDKFLEFLKSRNICSNIAGTLFYTHEHYTGKLIQFLIDRLSMRKIYQKERDKFNTTAYEYTFYDHRQNVMKTNANSSYGLTGMADFRFSNKWLALTTTVNGRLALKTAQMCGYLYLKDYNK